MIIKEYLIERKNIVSDILKQKQEKYEHNQIAIVEAKNKISELENLVDEASEMFSVRARENSKFKNHEVEELEDRIAIYVSEDNDLEKIIESSKKELEILDICLQEIENQNVSRETLEQKEMKKEKLGEENFVAKLEFIKRILNVDKERAFLEIDNLIKILR